MADMYHIDGFPADENSQHREQGRSQLFLKYPNEKSQCHSSRKGWCQEGNRISVSKLGRRYQIRRWSRQSLA